MDAHDFDSVLFPFNFVCVGQGQFGPQVLEKAKQKGVARLALKSMAHTRIPEGEGRQYPKCWYRPIEDEEQLGKILF